MLLDVQFEGKRAIIDLRERILNGEHPRHEVFEYVKKAPVDTIFEIHVPRPAKPLRLGLEEMGMQVALEELGAGHFRVLAFKLV